MDHRWPELDIGKRRRKSQTAGKSVSQLIHIGSLGQRNRCAMDGVAAEQQMNMVCRCPKVPIGDPDQLVKRRAELA